MIHNLGKQFQSWKGQATGKENVAHPSIFRTLFGIIKNNYDDDIEKAKEVSINFVNEQRFKARMSVAAYRGIVDTIRSRPTHTSLYRYFAALINRYESPEFQAKIDEALQQNVPVF